MRELPAPRLAAAPLGASLVGLHAFRVHKALRASAEDPASKLTAPAVAQEVSAPLLRAMCAIKKARPDVGPLGLWLAGNSVCNGTELYGISKYALGLRVSCERQLTQALDVVRWYSKIQLPVKHPDVHDAVRAWVDSVMCALWGRAKTQKLTWNQFVDLYKEQLTLIIAAEDLLIIQNAGQDYMKVQDALHKVVGASRAGHALFGFMLLQVLSFQVSDLIVQHVNTFRAGRMTTESLAASRAACLEAAEKLPNVELLPQSREITLKYRNETLKAVCAGVAKRSTQPM